LLIYLLVKKGIDNSGFHGEKASFYGLHAEHGLLPVANA
jgi:hypothetical protein